MGQWYEFSGRLVNLNAFVSIIPPVHEEQDQVWVITLKALNTNDDIKLRCKLEKSADKHYENIKELVLKKAYVVPFKLLE